MRTYQQDMEQRIADSAAEIVAASLTSQDAEDALARRILDEADLLDARIALARIAARAAVADAIQREQLAG